MKEPGFIKYKIIQNKKNLFTALLLSVFYYKVLKQSDVWTTAYKIISF